jgi:YD repeat-containing protein
MIYTMKNKDFQLRMHMKNRVVACLVGLAVMVGTLQVASAVDYTYDELQRLVRVDYGAGTSITYTYDAAGNRKTLVSQEPAANKPPVISKRSPTGNPTAVDEGDAAAFSVTANDSTDTNTAARGMVSVTWYVDGVQKQETKTGAPNAITSAFSFKTDASTVQGAAYRDVPVRAVALDKQGGTTETSWVVRVNNLLAAQTITFKALPVQALGDPDFGGATVSSGLPAVYTSSDAGVAEIVDGFVHIVGTGTALITASQPGNTDYKAAKPVNQKLTVSVKLRVTAEVPSGGGTVSGAGLYAPGAKVSLTAKPAHDYTFLHWEDGYGSQAPTRSLVMPGSNVLVSAVFGLTAGIDVPEIVVPAAQQATVGVLFTLPLVITSDCLAKAAVTGLPAGLKYDATTETISGVPTAPTKTPAQVNVMVSNVANPKPVLAASFNITVVPLPDWTVGTFNGYLVDGGTVLMTVTAPGKITGKLLTGGKSYSFSAASFARRDGTDVLWFTSSAEIGGTVQPVTFKVSNPAGAVPTVEVWLSSAASGEPMAKMYRNVWKDAGMADTLEPYIGYYTAVLPGGKDYGSGYLAFTVDKAGLVKTAGKLADGTAISLSNNLILKFRNEPACLFAVIYTSPTGYKDGCLFGLVEFVKPDSGNVFLRLMDEGKFTWENLDPLATSVYADNGFRHELGLSGGWYDKTDNLYEYYQNRNLAVGADLGAPDPVLNVGVNHYTSDWWNTSGIDITPVLSKTEVMTGLAVVPEAGLPVNLGSNNWNYDAEENTVGLKIGLARATGIFKGSFKAWFDYDKTHTSRSISYEGMLIPEREYNRDDKGDGNEGRGFYLWADKSQYLDSKGKTVTYPFNWSYDFLIQEEPQVN